MKDFSFDSLYLCSPPHCGGPGGFKPPGGVQGQSPCLPTGGAYKDVLRKGMPTTLTIFPELQQRLLAWYGVHGRPLPWRVHYEPYATWIAEVMMQQTQMERGVAYFERWMARFPDVRAVADADESALLSAWEGLGYYRRARNIQAAARVIMVRHGGTFPRDHADILALPGVGPYTAGAIASTAYNEPVPCVDGNVERVVSRLFDVDVPAKTAAGKRRIHELATALIPEGRARDFNQALMELGALVCRKKALCANCPVETLCAARHLDIVTDRPVQGRRTATQAIDVVTGVLERGGRVFIQRREDEGVWAGLWEFPGGCVEAGEQPEDAIGREWREELDFVTRVQAPITVIRHGYTTYRITLYCFRLELADDADMLYPAPPALREATAWQWVALSELARFPMPAPHRKLADFLIQHQS